MKGPDMAWFTSICLFVFLALAADNGAAAEYVDVSNPRNTIQLNAQERTFSVKDVVFDATVCERGKLICLSSKGFDFSVPRKISVGEKWTHNETPYEVRRKVEYPLLGRPGPFWLIKQDKDSGLWFVFSQTHGLVMLGGLGSSGTSVYVVMGRCGFGALSSCK